MILLLCAPIAFVLGMLGTSMAIASTMFNHWREIEDERRSQESYGTESYFDARAESAKLDALSKICLAFCGIFIFSAIASLTFGLIIWFAT